MDDIKRGASRTHNRSHDELAIVTHQTKPQAKTVSYPANGSLRLKVTKKLMIICILLVVIMFGVSTALLIYIRNRNQNNFPDEIVKNTRFTLFFPNQFPDGYSLDKTVPIRSENNIVSYSLNGPEKKTVLVSQQMVDNEYDYDNVEGTKNYRNLYGNVKILDFKDQTLAEMVTDKTWVLLNAPEPIGTEEMEKIISSLEPIR